MHFVWIQCLFFLSSHPIRCHTGQDNLYPSCWTSLSFYCLFHSPLWIVSEQHGSVNFVCLRCPIGYILPVFVQWGLSMLPPFFFFFYLYNWGVTHIPMLAQAVSLVLVSESWMWCIKLLEVWTCSIDLMPSIFSFNKQWFQLSVTLSHCFCFMALAFGVIFCSSGHLHAFFWVLVYCCGLMRVANTNVLSLSPSLSFLSQSAAFAFWSVFFVFSTDGKLD